MLGVQVRPSVFVRDRGFGEGQRLLNLSNSISYKTGLRPDSRPDTAYCFFHMVFLCGNDLVPRACPLALVDPDQSGAHQFGDIALHSPDAAVQPLSESLLKWERPARVAGE